MSSRRSRSRQSGGSRITDDQINDLVSKLQQLLPEIRDRCSDKVYTNLCIHINIYTNTQKYTLNTSHHHFLFCYFNYRWNINRVIVYSKSKEMNRAPLWKKHVKIDESYIFICILRACIVLSIAWANQL